MISRARVICVVEENFVVDLRIEGDRIRSGH